MGIFSRLGRVINSYMDDFSQETSSRLRSTGDPDLDAAYDELNDFLNDKGSSSRKKPQEDFSWQNTASAPKLPPEELRADFLCLGVPFGADAETCKTAYKNLVKIHHPDRHAGHEGNFKKATAKSAKINAAWDRIDKYYQTRK